MRGVIGTIILGKLMLSVNKRLLRFNRQPLPEDCFDMIGGSGTGGLIAIMLGRFGMSAPECTRKYTELSKEIFRDSNKKSLNSVLATKGSFKASTLECAIKRIAKEREGNQKAQLNNKHGNPCCNT